MKKTLILSLCLSHAHANLDLLKSWVNSKDCMQSDTAFVACAEALHTFASNESEQYFLWPTGDSLPKSFKSPKVIFSVDGLNLMQASQGTTEVISKKDWEQLRSQNQSRQNSLFHFFPTHFPKIDFEDLFNQQALRLRNKSKSELTNLELTSANAFLSLSRDPHTYLREESDFQAGAKSTDSYAGIGVLTEFDSLGILIHEVMPNSPALSSGLWHGDRILQLNGSKINNKNAVELLSKIRGKAGTKIHLNIKRGDSLFALTLTRAAIIKSNLEYQRSSARMPFSYYKLNSFEDPKACEQMRHHLIKEEPHTPIVLDLRDNGGGLVQEATCIAGLFVGDKLIATSKSTTDQSKYNYFSEQEQVSSNPLITLINANSASASELLAGALQHYKRSWIMGSNSFGKGSVQSPVPWSPGVLYFETKARYYLPSGLSTQLSGVKPDFEIFAFPEKDSSSYLELRERDLYANALSPKAPPIEPERNAQTLQLRRCTGQFAKTKETYLKKLYHQPQRPDFLLLAAQDLFNCEPTHSMTSNP